MTGESFEPPRRWPHRLLTVAEYLAVGETEFPTELVEGHVLVVPRPTPRHMKASYRLTAAVEAAPPTGYEVVQEVDVDLRLAAADHPGFVREPM
jgi:hypothetical protein